MGSGKEMMKKENARHKMGKAYQIGPSTTLEINPVCDQFAYELRG